MPLYLCLPEDAACFRRAGPEIVDVVDRQRRAVDVAFANTDHACLQRVVGLYRDSLAAYGKAGEAASAGDTGAAEAAMARTTDLEIAYMEAIGGCGFIEGRMAESSSALRTTGIELMRLEREFTACADEACVVEVAGRGRHLAGEAAAGIDEVLAGLPEEEPVPPCFPRALRDLRGSFEIAGSAMQAIEDLDIATAERESLRANELSAQALEDMAACMSSAGL